MQEMLNNNLKNIAAIVLLFLVIFTGLVLYFKKNQSAVSQPANISPKKEIIVEKVAESPKAKTKPTFSQEIEQILIEGTDAAPTFYPSKKSALIAKARQHKGKTDPFAGDNTEKGLLTDSKNMPNLPKMPSSESYASLPNMQSLPAAEFDTVTPEEEAPPALALKGFLNNKAIISYKGKTQAASTGQVVDDIKILLVSDDTSTVKYKVNGKILSASLPSEVDRSKILKPIK